MSNHPLSTSEAHRVKTAWVPMIFNPHSNFADAEGWECNHLLTYDTERQAQEFASQWAWRPRGRLLKRQVRFAARKVVVG